MARQEIRSGLWKLYEKQHMEEWAVSQVGLSWFLCSNIELLGLGQKIQPDCIIMDWLPICQFCLSLCLHGPCNERALGTHREGGKSSLYMKTGVKIRTRLEWKYRYNISSEDVNRHRDTVLYTHRWEVYIPFQAYLDLSAVLPCCSNVRKFKAACFVSSLSCAVHWNEPGFSSIHTCNALWRFVCAVSCCGMVLPIILFEVHSDSNLKVNWCKSSA